MSLISSKLECRSNFGVRRRGSHVESLRVVSRVEKEIRNLNRRYRDENVKDPKRRVLRRLGEDLTKLCNGLDGSDEALLAPTRSPPPLSRAVTAEERSADL